MDYKVRAIELVNIRNIVNGRIEFTNIKGEINKVTGIYGQNASGKSSVIKTIDFVRKLIDYRYTPENSEEMIHYDHSEAQIKIEILNDLDLVEYILHIKRDDDKVRFEREQLLINGDCIFEVNHATKQIIKNKLISRRSQTELTVITEIAYESGKSCFGSKYAFEQLYQKKLCNYPNAIEAIYKFSNKVNIISDHDSSSNNIDDNLVIFDFNQDGVDDLTIDLDNESLVHKDIYAKLEKQFSNLNMIVHAIVPTIELEICIEERGEKFYRLEYYTKRKGVDKLIPLAEESYGIKKIISLAFSLMQVMNKKDFILIVDELDAGIFEYLLGQLVETVDSYAQGQLIFTSHNLRAVEVLGSDSVIFTTSNPQNCFVKIPQSEHLSNMRETYYRSIILEGTTENLYNKTLDNDILMGLMQYD